MDVRNVPVSVAFQLFYTGEKGRVSNTRITQEALCKSHLFLGKKLSMASPKLSIENIYGPTRWLLDRLLLGISLLICQQVQCTTKSSASCCAMDGKSIAVLHPHNCWHFSSQKMGAGELSLESGSLVQFCEHQMGLLLNFFWKFMAAPP